MFLTKIQAPDETSARAALRRATDASHQRMHGLEPFAQIGAGTLPISQYRLLLESLFLFHSAVGRVARRAGWARLSSAERRLDLLQSDLSFLGGNVPEPLDDWQAGTGEAVLGALYAAEGSMLGGRVIARQLDYAFGSKQDGRQFFIGDKGDRENWSRLMVVLEERCAHPSTLNTAISGALRAFDWFERCVTCSSRANSGSAQSELPSAGNVHNLCYDDTMDDAPRPIRDRSWIKRSPRIDGQHEAIVVDSEGRLCPVTILDISNGGFKLQADQTFRIGEYIGLRVSKYGEFSAQIRWALGTEAGGVFLEPIVLPPSEQ